MHLLLQFAVEIIIKDPEPLTAFDSRLDISVEKSTREVFRPPRNEGSHRNQSPINKIHQRQKSLLMRLVGNGWAYWVHQNEPPY